MARRDILPMAGGGAGKKIVGLLFLAALVVFVVRNPIEAAGVAKSIGHFVASAVDGIATFARQVAQ
jgi:hypothetical protein